MAVTIILKIHALGVRLMFTRRSKPEANAFLDREVVATTGERIVSRHAFATVRASLKHVGSSLDPNQKEV